MLTSKNSPNDKEKRGLEGAKREISFAAREQSTYVDLSGIGLSSLPPELWQLTSIRTLVLAWNQLSRVPAEIGKLVELQDLYLHGNNLTTLPKEIGKLTKLRNLILTGNKLKTIPKEIGKLTELRSLELNDNELRSLPGALRDLPNLTVLILHGNPKLGLPPSVLGDEFHADFDSAPRAKPILDFYFRTLEPAEQRPLNEGKLILVGRGDVGKTSIVRRLVENKFSRDEDTTQGIRIRKWPVIVGKKKEEIRLHVWDFGGQEIMHATHQFFLTDRSLYLLVLDGRADQQEVEADYWLRLVSGFAPQSPVLVVLNKIKKNHFDLNRGALQQKFPQVKGFIETDCDNPSADGKPGKSGFGIDKLKRSILSQVDKLKPIRLPFPASWFAIKERLSEDSAGRKNFLTVEEYRNLCSKLGESDREAQMNLSHILHWLGIALNYSDDPRLNDHHVLNPHWLTTGIYTLLNSKTLVARKGELRLKDLAVELGAKDYPQDMHLFLINLMRKFDLCFEFEASGVGTKGKTKTAGRYLVPELLDFQQPDVALKFDTKKCLNFQYLYPVLPPGLVPRFIVRTHVLSETHRWKTGVILSFEGNEALVKADPQDHTVRVLIAGPVKGRRRMLAMIRQEFDAIHGDIPNLKPDELVSFPEHPTLTVPYTDLEVMYRNDPETPVVKVFEGQMITRTARQLLEGVEFGLRDSDPHGPTDSRSGQRSRVGKFAPEPLRVFYSYAHVDARPRAKLAKHLAPLERIGLIKSWYDNEILPGAQWEQEIADRLDETDLVLLLISPDFVASKYCYEVELKRAMERRAKKKTEVLAIIIRKTNAWEKLPAGEMTLGDLNALPTSGKPIPSWKPQDVGWANVAEGVQKAAEALLQQRG